MPERVRLHHQRIDFADAAAFVSEHHRHHTPPVGHLFSIAALRGSIEIHSRPGEDLYVIMATVDPMTQRATFQVKVRPLVWWIWFGGMLALGVVFLALIALVWVARRPPRQVAPADAAGAH